MTCAHYSCTYTDAMSTRETNISQPGMTSSLLPHVMVDSDNDTVDRPIMYPYQVDYLSELEPYHWITIFAVPPIVLLGLTGNLLSVCVMLRKRFRSTSTSVYLIALAVVDSIYLIDNFMFVNWVRIFFGIDIRLFSVLACQFYVYGLYVCKCLGAWLVVAVTFERLVAVKWPHRARDLCTRRRAYYAICGIILTTCTLYIYIPVVHTIWYEGPIGPDCSFTLPENLVLTALHFLDMFMYSLIPSILLLGTNIALIRSIATQTKTFTKANSRGKRLVKSDTRRLTAMLLAVSLTYLVLTFPVTAIHVYKVFVHTPKNWVEIYTTAYSISLVNNAINFVLYCVSGPAFRQEVGVFFCSLRSDSRYRANNHQRPYSIKFVYTSQMFQKSVGLLADSGSRTSTKKILNG